VVTLPTGAFVGDVVRIYQGTTLIGQSPALTGNIAENGTVTVPVNSAFVGDGIKNISASLVMAGIESAKSDAIAVYIDTTVPNTAGQLSGAQLSDGYLNLLESSNGLTLSGLAEPGSTVTVTFAQASSAIAVTNNTAVAASNGAWSMRPSKWPRGWPTTWPWCSTTRIGTRALLG
jgi:hypothetical protein